MSFGPEAGRSVGYVIGGNLWSDDTVSKAYENASPPPRWITITALIVGIPFWIVYYTWPIILTGWFLFHLFNN